MTSTTWTCSTRRNSAGLVPRRLFAALALGVLAFAPASRSAAAQEPPRAVVQKTIDAVLVVLNEKDLTTEQKRAKIEAIAYERFDFDTLSRLVLARNWSKFHYANMGDLAPFDKESIHDYCRRELNEEIETWLASPLIRAGSLTSTREAPFSRPATEKAKKPRVIPA